MVVNYSANECRDSIVTLFYAPWPEGKKLARLAGLEPAAYGLEVRCSIQLSYRRLD